MQAKSSLLRQLVYCMCVSLHIFLNAEEPVEIEKKSSDAIIKFIKNYRNGCFTYIADGPMFGLPSEVTFGIWMTAKSKETVKSGRVLAATFLTDYFTELQNNPDTSKWYRNLCNRKTMIFSGNLSLKNIAVRIAFWDENVDRPKAPYLAEIDFYNNKFMYYEADPKTQALKLVLEEPYEDAVKQLQSVDK